MASQPTLSIGAMPDLAPAILRQRLIVEGISPTVITDETIRQYLSELSDVCEMRRLMDPVTHRSKRYGWAGWIHWEESGAHFYSWDQPVLFFSADIYTCKPFDSQRVLEFTSAFFDAGQIVGKEV